MTFKIAETLFSIDRKLVLGQETSQKWESILIPFELSFLFASLIKILANKKDNSKVGKHSDTF